MSLEQVRSIGMEFVMKELYAIVLGGIGLAAAAAVGVYCGVLPVREGLVVGTVFFVSGIGAGHILLGKAQW